MFEQTLQELGWTVGRDLKIENREVGSDVDRLRRYAAELVALAPDAIFSWAACRPRRCNKPLARSRSCL